MSAALTKTDQRAPIAMQGRGIVLQSFDEMARFCLGVVKSGMAPKGLDTPEKVMVALEFGLELGLFPVQAIQSIAVINGKPSVWGDTALALVKAHEDFEDIEESLEGGNDDMIATCKITRRGQTPVERSFTVAQAKRAGLWGKSGPWQQYPQRMLQMRARSWAMRDSFPDALKGVGIREEVQDFHRDPPRQTTIEPPQEVAGLSLPDEEEVETAPEQIVEEELKLEDAQ